MSIDYRDISNDHDHDVLVTLTMSTGDMWHWLWSLTIGIYLMIMIMMYWWYQTCTGLLGHYLKHLYDIWYYYLYDVIWWYLYDIWCWHELYLFDMMICIWQIVSAWHLLFEYMYVDASMNVPEWLLNKVFFNCDFGVIITHIITWPHLHDALLSTHEL